MDADEFVIKLKNAMPSVQELRAYGIENRDDISDIQATFLALPKEHDGIRIFDSGIEKLFALYDFSRVEVGMIRFNADLVHQLGCVQFAKVESDEMVIDSDGKIHLNFRDGHNNLVCALNSSALFDALAEFLEIRKNKKFWKGRVSEAAIQCSTKSGIDSSLKFYEMLCGFLHTYK